MKQDGQAAQAPKWAILGTGHMGEALLAGLLDAGVVAPRQVCATARSDARLATLRKQYSIATTHDNVAATRGAGVVILAVKPQLIDRLLREIGGALAAETLVLSIAAGVGLRTLESKLPPRSRCIRAMPNTPVLVRAGATTFAKGSHATAEDVALAQQIFEAVGTAVSVEEDMLDAATGLAGCGPAYVFLIVEALCDAGVNAGLPRAKALALAVQTILGSSKLLLETGQHPSVLKDQVTSPGGATIVGLHALEAGGLRNTLINAVIAANERARALGLDDK